MLSFRIRFGCCGYFSLYFYAFFSPASTETEKVSMFYYVQQQQQQQKRLQRPHCTWLHCLSSLCVILLQICILNPQSRKNRAASTHRAHGSFLSIGEWIENKHKRETSKKKTKKQIQYTRRLTFILHICRNHSSI